jgi:hypothetical protein
MNPAVRVVRILQISVIVSVLLFIYVLQILHPAAHSVSAPVQWALVLCAIASAEIGFIGQRMLLRPREPSLPATQNSTPLARWTSGHILRFATAESVALFGFVLRILGSYSIVVYLLFGSSLFLLVIWRPGACPPQDSAVNTSGLIK